MAEPQLAVLFFPAVHSSREPQTQVCKGKGCEYDSLTGRLPVPRKGHWGGCFSQKGRRTPISSDYPTPTHPHLW